LYGAKAFKNELKGVIRDLRPAWLLEELGVPYERVVLDWMKGETKTPEYLKLNPTGKVPTLVDGNMVLFESAAICEYLAEKHKRFIPAVGSEAYYKCRQWNYWNATNVEPLIGRVFAADFFLDKGDYADQFKAGAMEALPRLLNPLNAMLAERAFINGPEFMITDIFVCSAMQSIKHTTILNDYPNLQRYLATCTARPAFKRASAANGL